jgi:Fe-S-cluster containining protein
MDTAFADIVMEDSTYSCRRCGTCCLANYIAFVTDEDLSRWHAEDRQDILHVLEHGLVIWAGDRLISTKNGHYEGGCPFLEVDGDQWRCSIYETRPQVCRNYQPASSEICPQWKGYRSV